MPSVIYIHCSPYKSHQSQSSNLQDIRNKISHLHFYKLRRLHRCNHGFHHRTHRYPDMYRFYLIVIQKIFIKDSKNFSLEIELFDFSFFKSINTVTLKRTFSIHTFSNSIRTNITVTFIHINAIKSISLTENNYEVK